LVPLIVRSLQDLVLLPRGKRGHADSDAERETQTGQSEQASPSMLSVLLHWFPSVLHLVLRIQKKRKGVQARRERCANSAIAMH
jgi:hypothetical protein